MAQDLRLVGMWNHHTFYSSGGFSYSHTRSRLLYRNGRYVEGSQSSVTMISRNSSGDETGQRHGSNVSSDKRGDWTGADGILTLSADNGDAYEFRYKIEGKALMLSQPGRDPQLWQH